MCLSSQSIKKHLKKKRERENKIKKSKGFIKIKNKHY